LDIFPGQASSGPTFLAAVGGGLLFAAEDGLSGVELWRTDGTEAGTFFVADDGESGWELWVSDGTAEGTRRVADLWPGPAASDPTEIVAIGDRVFFIANDGVHGRELWVSGGEDGTKLVNDLNRGPGSSVPVRRLGSRMIALGEKLYFGATDGGRGVELWRSDGTAAGTRLVQDINPGPGSSTPENFTVAGPCLYFSATDGEHGFELWTLQVAPSAEERCSGSAGGSGRRRIGKRAAGRAPKRVQ